MRSELKALRNRLLVAAVFSVSLGAGCELWLDGVPTFAPPPCIQDERVKVEGDSARYLCVPCAPGSTNEGGDERLDGTSQCEPTLCSANERVDDHVCTDCREGTTNPAGDVATGPDTECAPILCAFGERVSGKVCVMCPAGQFNLAGDDASGGDTQCDDNAMCGENERVQDGACVACAAGETRPAGDLLGGGDTECVATSCERDQYVLGNACVACPAGATNEPGDDASGEDTQCTDVCFETLGLFCGEFNEAYIKASNTGAGDAFGDTIAFDGDTLVVGARGEASSSMGVDGVQNDDAPRSGAVYVFERDASRVWRQTAFLKASNAGVNDGFGRSVSLDADTLVVGASGEDSWAFGVNPTPNESAENSGAAYVFERDAMGQWAQTAFLKASNTEPGDGFGGAVAVSGDYLVVGAPAESSSATGLDGDQDDNGARGSGAAYVFERNELGIWSQRAYLKASNTAEFGEFGTSLDIDGDIIAVGTEFEGSGGTGINSTLDEGGALESGAVYVFERSRSSARST